MGEMTKRSEAKKQAWAVSELKEKQKELGRFPRKDDFDVVTLSRIKAFLGPWPRALEKAGLKEAKPEKKKKKRRLGSAETVRKATKETSLLKSEQKIEKYLPQNIQKRTIKAKIRRISK